MFEVLTERKKQDAALLIPADDTLARDTIGTRMDELCFLLARMLYRRLSGPDHEEQKEGRDGLPVDAVDKELELQPYVRPVEPVTALDALLHVGLLVRTRISQRDPEGRMVESNAYAFFSDQYTQYWLAAAYQRAVIGWADQKTLSSPGRVQELAVSIDRVIAASVSAPVLAGALDHWLQKNLKAFYKGRLTPLRPLLDQMAAGSAASRHYAMALPIHLLLSGYIAPVAAFETLCGGSEALRLEAVNAFAVFWPALPPWALRAYLDASDADSKMRVADVFLIHAILEPEHVVGYLRRAITPITLANAAEALRIGRQAPFVLQFSVLSAISCFDQPSVIAAVRRFFRATYAPVVALAEGRSRSVLIRSLRPLVFLWLEFSGRSSWKKFIADFPESGNDRFATPVDGVNQQAVLAEFLPYAIALHNGELDELSLMPESPFRLLSLRMLSFRPMSIIGFSALLCLPSVLVRLGWSEIEAFVMELLGRRSASAAFYANLLLVNLAYVDPALALPALTLMRDQTVPWLLREKWDSDWSIPFCAAAVNVPETWPVLTEILDRLLSHAEEHSEVRQKVSNQLYKACYCQDIRLGRNLITLMMGDPERFLGSVWRNATLQAILAMETRTPSTLESILGDRRMELVREARSLDERDEVVRQSMLFPIQVALNRFLAWTWVAEPALRFAAVKFIVGGLALGGSAEDFVAGMRQVLITFIRFFFGDDPGSLPRGRLSVEEIAASVRTSRRRPRQARTA